jgi:hypothetical protein
MDLVSPLMQMIQSVPAVGENLSSVFGLAIAMGLGLGCMVFNATFNNISVLLWQSVLLVEET